jgi:hypothetical protein
LRAQGISACVASPQKRFSKKNGFDRFEDEVTDASDRYAVVAGYHSSEFITAQITCHQKLGLAILGVAGLDNNITYEVYKQLARSEW